MPPGRNVLRGVCHIELLPRNTMHRVRHLGDELVLREVVLFLLVKVRFEDLKEEVAADMAPG